MTGVGDWERLDNYRDTARVENPFNELVWESFGQQQISNTFCCEWLSSLIFLQEIGV